MKNLLTQSVKVLFLAVLTVGCFTTNKVQTLDTRLDVKGQVGDRKLGLNDKNEAILQEEVAAESELTTQINVSYYKQERLEMVVEELKICMTERAKLANGGSGSYPSIPESTALKNLAKTEEEFGLVGGNLRIVRKSSFVETLKMQRLLVERIEKEHNDIKRLLEQCEFDRENSFYARRQKQQKQEAENKVSEPAPQASSSPKQDELNDLLQREGFALQARKS